MYNESEKEKKTHFVSINTLFVMLVMNINSFFLSLKKNIRMLSIINLITKSFCTHMTVTFYFYVENINITRMISGLPNLNF
jgi:hypothetical protein